MIQCHARGMLARRRGFMVSVCLSLTLLPRIDSNPHCNLTTSVGHLTGAPDSFGKHDRPFVAFREQMCKATRKRIKKQQEKNPAFAMVEKLG